MPAGRPRLYGPDSQCAVEDCDRSPVSRGWCNMHYRRWRIHGDPEVVQRERTPPAECPDTCTIPEGCDRPHYAKGACHSHYQSRWQRLGSLELPPRARKPKGPKLGPRLSELTACLALDCPRNPDGSRGYCGMHYMRLLTHGSPYTVLNEVDPDRGCAVPGCERKHSGKGYCKRHYRAFVFGGEGSTWERLLRSGFTDDQIWARLSMFGCRCWMCGVGLAFREDAEIPAHRQPGELDHVKPRGSGGPDLLSNIRPACPTCNRTKFNHWVEPGQSLGDFLQSLYRGAKMMKVIRLGRFDRKKRTEVLAA